MQYLLTHSLLYSWLYALKENVFADSETETANPFEDFLKVLKREPTETTPAMQKGIDFEDLVTDICVGNKIEEDNPWTSCAKQVADYVKGGVLQYRAKKVITVQDMDILLYGRLDALKKGVIYDIKFSGSYERGKFYESTQHPVYLELIPEAKEFVYLISNGSSVWTERYTREETADIRPLISDFLDWLNAVGLMDVYKERWKAL